MVVVVVKACLSKRRDDEYIQVKARSLSCEEFKKLKRNESQRQRRSRKRKLKKKQKQKKKKKKKSKNKSQVADKRKRTKGKFMKSEVVWIAVTEFDRWREQQENKKKD